MRDVLKMNLRLGFLWALTISLVSCATVRQTGELSSGSHLRLVNVYEVPFDKKFDRTTIGGLSGIDRDAQHDLYYLISDDRSSIDPARFYTARIRIGEKGIDSVNFVAATSLRQPDGNLYPDSKQDPFHTPDPEALRYDPRTRELVWTSEGERIVKKDKLVLEDPSIIAMDKKGRYRDSFALPPNLHMHATENGPRQNGVFEGLTFSDDYRSMYVSVEEPLYEDGPRAGLRDSTGWIRIIRYDVASRRPIAQYAYQIEAVAYPPSPEDAFRINGVPDILYLGKDRLLVVERSFSTGRNSCTIRLFLADLTRATDVQSIVSLRSEKNWVPASKTLLLNMDSLGIYTDNIEGVTFGPRLPNGHQTLIFVADNNFSREQITQFLLFEIE
jgi:hypothetical protein